MGVHDGAMDVWVGENDVDDDERLRREIQASMAEDDEPVTERSASDAYDDVYGNLPLRRRR